MQALAEADARHRLVGSLPYGEDGGVRGALALPPDFAKCGGIRQKVEAPPR